MRLLSCYIAGFGKIKNYNFTFEPGMNAFLEENGWGKTTFTVFIKSMFYGLEYSSRRKGLTERTRYAPWDGGEYGGTLRFAVGGRRYQIERSFGRKDRNDTFRLIDLDTMKESKDYSENIGEEIFEVDRESFEKSIFIPQEALDTGLTDSLNAHMGGQLKTTREDVTRFEEAIGRIDKVSKDYTRNSKTNTGRLVLLHRDLLAQQEQADRIPDAQEALTRTEELLNAKRGELSKLSDEKKTLTEQIAARSRQEQVLGAWREKKQQLEELEEQLDEADTFFVNGIPTAEQMSAVTDMEHQLSVHEKELEGLKAKLPKPEFLTELKEIFRDGIPQAGQFTAWRNEAAHLKELRMQRSYAKMSDENRMRLTELREYFSVKNPTREELDLISGEVTSLAEVIGQTGELDRRRSELAKQKEKNQEKHRLIRSIGSLSATLLIGLAIIIGGLIFLGIFFDRGGALTLATSILFFGAAAALFITYFISFARRRKEDRAQIERTSRELDRVNAAYEEALKRQEISRKICEDFLSSFPEEEGSMQQRLTEIQIHKESYDRLLEAEAKAIDSASGAVEESANASMQLYTVLQPYADHYQMDLYHDYSEEELLNRLEEDAQTWQTYLTDQGQAESLEEQVHSWQEEVADFLAKYPVTKQSRHECIAEIRLNMDRMQDLMVRTKMLDQEVRQEARSMQQTDDGTSVEWLQTRQQEVDSQIADLIQQIHDLRDDLGELTEELEGYEEARDSVADLKSRESIMQKQVQILEDTKKYLNQAREHYLSHYMGPLQTGLRHYLNYMGGQKLDVRPEDFVLDMDLNPKVIYQGQVRTGEYLSAGYHDMIALCARFALIDVIFHGEKPIVVLDDPFANLDEDKIANALALLGQVAKERQLIYFTCHPSRMPEAESDQSA